MAISVRKKSSYIFSPPSYIKKGGALESKVEKIINELKITSIAPVKVKTLGYFTFYWRKKH